MKADKHYLAAQRGGPEVDCFNSDPVIINNNNNNNNKNNNNKRNRHLSSNCLLSKFQVLFDYLLCSNKIEAPNSVTVQDISLTNTSLSLVSCLVK